MKVKNKFLTKTFKHSAQQIIKSLLTVKGMRPFWQKGFFGFGSSLFMLKGIKSVWPLLMMSLLFNPSCVVNLDGQDIPLTLPSIGGGPSSSNSEYFYVDLNTAAYNDESRPLYEISTTEEFNNSEDRDSRSNCEIEYIPVDDDEDPESSATLVCIMDIPEWEFITNNLNMVVNIPGGMCKDVSISLPWHFNFPIQPGPYSRECDFENGEESIKRYCNVGINANNELNNCPPATPYPPSGVTCREEEENLCTSLLDEGGTRCCARGGKTDGSRWEPDANCFGGPATIANGYEFPAGQITSLPEDGLRQSIVLPNLTSINGAVGASPPNEFPPIYQTTSFPFANYLEILDVPGDEIEDISEGNLPDFLQRTHYQYAPRAFFEFKCLGRAGETLHEILLMIREWNTMEEFLNFYEAGGDDESDPNVEGNEGDDCPYEERQTGGYGKCNDLLDLEDCTITRNQGPWCIGEYPGMNYSR